VFNVRKGEKVKKLFLILLVLIASSFSAQAAEYSSGYSSSKALVIGVNKYLLWPHLEYAVADAREISTILKEKNFDVTSLFDGKATKRTIELEINRLVKGTDINSRIFLYFAGHGQTEDIPGGGEKGYIVPVDSDLYNWQDTMLSMKKINTTIRNSKAKHIFLAFDSCYSGLGLTRGVKVVQRQDPGYIEKMMHLRSIQVLTAGGRSEQAIEADGHGLFTDHLIAALSGVADINADGYTTGTEIYATLRPSVTKLSFNRQTPQFGYLEGEGDFIFKARQKSYEPAFITVNTRIEGIDVWINNSPKGRRMAKGSHTLDTLSGRNAILVKKGSRTLFSKTVELGPRQNYRIGISNDAHTSKKRQPFAMFTIASKKVPNFSNSIAVDIDNDGFEEIITSSGKTVYVFKKDGTIIWEKSYAFGIGLNFVDDFNDSPAIALSGRSHDIIHLILLDRTGNEIWHNKRRITARYKGKPDGGGRFAKLADINGDGKKEIIAFSSAGYAWKPRGIIVYDASGHEMWRYQMGPSPTNLVVWKDQNGPADIILGGYSPGNGNRERHNNTDDMHTYVISINHRGKTNWVKPLGSHYTGTKVFVMDGNGDGSKQLYAHKWTAYDYRKDEGAVYQFDRNGRIVNDFKLRDSIKSVTFSRFKNRPNFLYASDKNGYIYQLDKSLNVVSKRYMNRKSIPLMINLVGVHDYDGDRKNDLLLYSYNRLQKGKNPRSDYGPKNKVHYTGMKFQILSGDLTRVIKEVSIAEEWDRWRGFKIIDVNRPEMAQYPFISLSDKVTVFNY